MVDIGNSTTVFITQTVEGNHVILSIDRRGLHADWQPFLMKW